MGLLDQYRDGKPGSTRVEPTTEPSKPRVKMKTSQKTTLWCLGLSFAVAAFMCWGYSIGVFFFWWAILGGLFYNVAVRTIIETKLMDADQNS